MDSFVRFVCYSTFFVLITCFLVYYFITSRKTLKWKESNIPFLQPLFLIGHKYFLDRKSLMVGLDRIHRETNEGVVAFFMTVLPVILIKDPKIVKKIFAKNSEKTFQTFLVMPEDDIVRQSIISISSDRALWKIGHTALGPVFSTLRMGGAHFDVFKQQMDRLHNHIEDTRLSGQPISVPRISFNFAADSTFGWHLGEHTNSYKENTGLHDALRGFFDIPPFKLICYFLLIVFPSLWKCNIDLFRLMRQKDIDYIRNLLERKMKYRLKNGTKRDDLIDLLMSFRGKGMSQPENGKGGNFTGDEEEIRLRQITGYAITVLLGSVESIPNLCQSTVHLLSLHPHYQQRIKEEIDNVMKKHGVSEITFEVIQDLQFTEQCVYEAARLFPLAFFLMRRCSEDFHIPGTNYKFRKGDLLIAVPYSVQRDPENFKNPDQYDPERFHPDNLNATFLDNFINFGRGPRKCPGSQIGVKQAVMFVASLVFKYEIRPRSHPKQMTAEDFGTNGGTIRPKTELLIDLIPR